MRVQQLLFARRFEVQIPNSPTEIQQSLSELTPGTLQSQKTSNLETDCEVGVEISIDQFVIFWQGMSTGAFVGRTEARGDVEQNVGIVVAGIVDPGEAIESRRRRGGR